MSRLKRDVELTGMQVLKEDHDWIYLQKHGSAEQLSAVLHRILGEYRNSEVGALQELYQEQIKVTQRWMAKYYEVSEKLKAKNQTLDVVSEAKTESEIVDESKQMNGDEIEKDVETT